MEKTKIFYLYNMFINKLHTTKLIMMSMLNSKMNQDKTKSENKLTLKTFTLYTENIVNQKKIDLNNQYIYSKLGDFSRHIIIDSRGRFH